MNPLNWLQHLFTLRAIQAERDAISAELAKANIRLAQLELAVADKEKQISKLQAVIDSQKVTASALPQGQSEVNQASTYDSNRHWLGKDA